MQLPILKTPLKTQPPRMKKLKLFYPLILFSLLASTQVKAQSVDVIIKENGTDRKSVV